MSRTLKALFVSLPLALPLAFAAGGAQAQEFGYNEAERQQELLGVWHDVRTGNAERGDLQAMFDVGMASYRGRGTEVDYDRAMHWLSQAADADHPRAHYYLGYMFAAGLGTEADAERSFEHYMRSAELGDPGGQYWLGSRYAGEEHRDHRRALEWIGKAAGQGLAAAQYHLGYLHETGRGTRRDHAEAAKWYARAAGQGERPAQIRLGRLYQHGMGVERDLVEAYVWYSRAGDEDRLAGLEGRMNRQDLATAESRLDEGGEVVRATAP